MRFLIDNALSEILSDGLRGAGHDAIHVREIGMKSADDEDLLRKATEDGRILVTADTDFGALLALRQSTQPSVILFRRRTGRRPREQLTLLLDNLDRLATHLESGSIVAIEDVRIRVRPLPIGGDLP